MLRTLKGRRTLKRLVALFTLLAIVLLSLDFTGVLPIGSFIGGAFAPCGNGSVPSGTSGTECVAGNWFHYNTFPLPSPNSTNTSPTLYSYRNVSFGLWYLEYGGPNGNAIAVNGTEQTGLNFTLVVTDGPPRSPSWDTQISSDHHLGAQWSVGGSSIRLLAV